VPELLNEANDRITYRPHYQADRDQEFEAVCKLHPEMRVEMDQFGNIIVMPPGSPDSGFHSLKVCTQLDTWTEKDGTGRAFDATTVWSLPDGSKMSPDASWAPKTALRNLGRSALRSISKAYLCPSFLIEVRSPTDNLREQKEKCWQWVRNGAQEVFLIDPENRTVFCFYPSAETQVIQDAHHLPSRFLNGFVLECDPIWEELTD
jgi:Uma2 family endonuclease